MNTSAYDAQEKFKHTLSLSSCTGGYYTEKLMNQTGFRMLVLNTNLYYDQNKLTTNMDDPADQFSWSDQILTEATNNKEKAKHLILFMDVWMLGTRAQ